MALIRRVTLELVYSSKEGLLLKTIAHEHVEDVEDKVFYDELNGDDKDMKDSMKWVKDFLIGSKKRRK